MSQTLHQVLRMIRIDRRSVGQAVAFVLVAIALLLIAAPMAPAAVQSFEANLDGLQVVAPNASPAFGFADISLDTVSGAVTINSGTYQDLLGGANDVTLHGLAGPGVNTGTLFFLTLDTPGATSGTFSGGGILNAMGVAGMQAGNTYILIRSQVIPGGEIRGQIFPAEVPEPGSIMLAVVAALGLAAGKQRRVARR